MKIYNYGNDYAYQLKKKQTETIVTEHEQTVSEPQTEPVATPQTYAEDEIQTGGGTAAPTEERTFPVSKSKKKKETRAEEKEELPTGEI